MPIMASAAPCKSARCRRAWRSSNEKRGTNLRPVRFVAGAVSIAALACTSLSCFAQSTDQPTYVVTYVEAAPKAATEARELIVARCAAARKAPGLSQIEAFVRTGYASQFAMLEQWQSAKAREDFAAT